MNFPVAQRAQPADAHGEPFLAADVGGTHVRIGLVAADAGGPQPLRVMHYRVYRGAEWADLASVLEHFIGELAETGLTDGSRPQQCVVASAGYVVDDRVVSENLPWPVSVRDLRERLGISRLEVINDFAAVAWGTQSVVPEDAHTVIDAPPPAADGPVLVMGPGTGLGSAVFLPGTPGARVLRTEAGHAALAPGNARERAILEVLARDRPYVAIEDALSGPGLLCLYRAICELEHRPAPLTTPSAITQAASGTADDADAVEAVQVFCGLLGSFVGDLVLLYGATGGVYLAGGILSQILPLLLASTFAERYFNKGVMRAYLEQVPVRLIEHGQLGVIGAALWYLASGAQAEREQA